MARKLSRGPVIAHGASMNTPAHASCLGIDRVHVLLNPRAGSSPANKVEEIGRMFADAGIHADIETVAPHRLTERLEQLKEQGVRAVGVGGGDGTMSCAANALAGTDIVLIPLALGTLNHFANRYGMGKLAAVTPALLDGAISEVDVGKVNGRVFINNASCGFYPHMVRHRDRIKGAFTKWPAALLATILVTLKRPLLEVLLRTDKEQIRRNTTAVWIGLGRNSLKLPVPGDAATEGNVLEVVIPRPRSRLYLMLVALRVWLRLRQHKNAVDSQIEVLRVKEFALQSQRPIDLATDGEPCSLGDHLEFSYQPGALKVLCMVAPT
jgi:diacylglycerol kinase family enzyme